MASAEGGLVLGLAACPSGALESIFHGQTLVFLRETDGDKRVGVDSEAFSWLVLGLSVAPPLTV